MIWCNCPERTLLNHRADSKAADQRGLDATQLAKQQGNDQMINLLERAKASKR